MDTVRTVVEVPYTAPIVGAGYAWSLDQPIHVPANPRVTIPIVLDAPAVQLMPAWNPALIQVTVLACQPDQGDVPGR